MSLSFVKNSLSTRHIVTALGLSLLLLAGSATAGDREKARRMYDRLAGVPPTNAELDTMVPLMATDPYAAADIAMTNPNFLNVTVKNMVIPWTNEEQTVFAPLNDTAATLIGMIRDGHDFRKVLYGDILYKGVGVTAAYSQSNNNHYVELENRNLPLITALEPSIDPTTPPRQSDETGAIDPAGIAGVLTTRASAREFFDLGTNRAMFRFTMMNYLCTDLEQLKDITRTPNRIRQDVSRSPGGDSSVFLNNCIGCHAGMDGLAGAFAYHEWLVNPVDADDPDVRDTGHLVYATTTNPVPDYTLGTTTYSGALVQSKIRHNQNNFIYGYFTENESWINYWRTGVNAKLGWDGTVANQPVTNPQTPSTGNGPASLGMELANTDAFSRCQVTKVYRHVCFNDPDQATLQTLMSVFSSNNYNLRTVFAESAIQCQGD